jgi:hypothetical protein
LAALEIWADDETNWVAALVDLKLRIDSGDFTGFEPVSPIENDTFGGAHDWVCEAVLFNVLDEPVQVRRRHFGKNQRCGVDRAHRLRRGLTLLQCKCCHDVVS